MASSSRNLGWLRFHQWWRLNGHRGELWTVIAVTATASLIIGLLVGAYVVSARQKSVVAESVIEARPCSLEWTEASRPVRMSAELKQATAIELISSPNGCRWLIHLYNDYQITRR